MTDPVIAGAEKAASTFVAKQEGWFMRNWMGLAIGAGAGLLACLVLHHL